MRSAAVAPDADDDGMPDTWEAKFCLDPHHQRDAAGDLDNDGYTNIEEFLNATDPSVKDVRQQEK